MKLILSLALVASLAAPVAETAGATSASKKWEEASTGVAWSHGIKPPFDSHEEHSGKRTVEGWRSGGAARVMQNFIRLTPDKQSMTGYLFCPNEPELNDFKALLKFRVSGRGQDLHGDGLAFWFTQTEHFVPGLLLGSTDMFRGIGILFDTYENDERHVDISVVAGNGVDPVTPGSQSFPGCSSKFRRWEGRQDWTVDTHSEAKITLIGNRISVEIDALGDGNFEKCVTNADLSQYLPKSGDAGGRGRRKKQRQQSEDGKAESWKTKAHFALSASTGALSDNHDILELTVTEPDVFETFIEAEKELEEQPAITIDVSDPNMDTSSVASSVNDLSSTVKDIESRITKLQHQIEHEIEKVSTHLESLINAVTQQEDQLDTRVRGIEQMLADSVMVSFQSRIAELESKLDSNFNQKSARLEMNLAHKLESKLDDKVESTTRATLEKQSWPWWYVLPFGLLFALVGGAVSWLIVRVRKLDARDKRMF